MKITKKIEKEILQVMDDYWGSYFHGDLQSWAAYLPDDYRNIGTTKAEIWNSKKEIVDFTESIIDQTVGMAEVRHKKTQIIPYDPYIMVHELGDLHVKAEEGWIFYAQFRLSSLLENTADGWKILHQHGSFPDAKAAEGEAFGFDELKIENKKLRDAIQSRTIELERKNRELEIESALERVRAVAMSMKTPAELQSVGEIVFTELKALGFDDLRNTEIIINQDEKQSILSYYYSDYGVSGQIEVDYTSHPVLKKWAEDLQTAGDGFAGAHISESEMVEWKKYREELGYIPDPKLDKAKSLDYYSYSTGLGALSISTFDPISEEQLATLERFRNVFGLAYRRYVDVEQAEAQAREAQIEAALERVRAKTMAMHSSEDVGQCILKLFGELTALGVHESTRLGIGIFNHDNENMELWTASKDEEGTINLHSGNIDMTAHPLLISARKAWKEKRGINQFILNGKEDVLAYFQIVNAFPDYPVKIKTHRLPDKIIHYDFIFDQGIIYAFCRRPLPDELIAVFQRFSSLFEQTYRRYLDLVRAEAQAREAQIEAALEKVRSRSLAVNRSEEFNEVVGVVFEKLSELGMPVGSVTIALTKKGTKDWEVYGCGEGDSGLSLIKFTLPYFPNAFSDDIIAAQSSAESGYFSKVYTEEEKNQYYEFAFKNTELKNLPEDIKQRVWQSKSYALSVAHTKNSVIMVNEFEGKVLNEGQAGILKRFSRVFEQTYIRFLDLQRAEAQAHEAEIQLALERIRARTMAMQHSDELKAASGVLIQQVLGLGIPAFSCGYNIFGEDADECTAWMSTPDGGINPAINIPLTEDPNFIRFAKSKKQGEEFYVLEMRGAAMQRHYQYLSDTIPVFAETFNAIRASGQSLPSTQIHHIVNFTYGNLMFITLEPCPDAHDIFKRFGKVFEQTYTRFLDLQKAEAQAREAQIEAALERVRSVTMAMHKTEELAKVVKVLFQQFQELEIDIFMVFVGIYIYSLKDKYVDQWFSPIEGIKDEPFYIRLPSEPWEDTTIKEWRAGKKMSYESVHGVQAVLEYSKAVDAIANWNIFERMVRKFSIELIEQTEANHKYGNLSIVQNRKATKTEKAILKRFAKVFEQTYTRFLDLQKAEAQAREAQIEAALERVRSRSLAMHNTSEIQEVIHTVHEELLKLNISIQGGSFVVINEDIDNELYCWGAGGTANTSELVHIPHFGKPFCTNLIKGIKQGPGFFIEEFTQQEKKDYFTELFKHTPWSKLSSQEKKETLNEKGGYTRSCCVSKYTSIIIINQSGRKFSDEENNILKRFSRVFEQTYTRFLDLQKAEEQAREAEIEAALERVRSATMAMHQSSELHQAASVLFEQLSLLGVNLFTCGFVLCEEDNPLDEQWMYAPNAGKFVPQYIPHKEERVHFNLYKAWKSGTPLYSETIEGQELEEMLKFLMAQPSVQKNISQIISEGVEIPKLQKLHGATFSKGYLLIITTSHFPEEQLFTRFAKVFEQTYTRFLDLQKAEAQAREAEIQLALERVRARTMAMQRSDELSETSFLLAQQVRELGIKAWGCAFHVYADNEEGDYEWFSTEKGYLPFYKTPRKKFFKQFYERHQSGESFYIKEFKGKACKKHYDFLMTIPVVGDALNDMIKSGISLPASQIDHIAYFNKGYLLFITYEPVPEAHEIFKRFAKEFEQTYTRFLDLQKVEAQAREAQIEAALERVRAQTMAMHNSEDVGKCVVKMFGELTALGVDEGTRFGIGILNHDNENNQLWTASKDGEEVKMHIGNLEMSLHPLLKSARKAWKAQVPLHKYVLEGEDLLNYYQMLNNAPDYQIGIALENLPEREIHYGFIFDHGFFYAFSPREFQPDLINTIQRFSSLFGQTYRRYLDLVKAEKQARKAQIEAALERLRAKAMSMHHSDELDEVLAVLCEQFDVLGIVPMSAHLTVLDIENNKFTFRETGKFGNRSFGEQTVALDAMDTWKDMVESWKNAEPFSINSLHFPKETLPQVWEVFHESFASMPEESRITPDDYPDGIYHTAGKHPFGYIGMNQIRKATKEEEGIVMKFANEFGRAYQRFLDLKKAEAQAREAQIEAALERTRTQSMLMQHSDELNQLSNVFHEQLLLLGLPSEFSYVWLPDEKNKTHMFWATWTENPPTDKAGNNRTATSRSKAYTYPLDKTEPYTAACYEMWESDESVFVNRIQPEEVEDFFSTWSELVSEAESLKAELFPDGLYYAEAYMKYGCFGINIRRPLSEEEQDVLHRFSIGFERAYTRFLDLKKAEAQTREAQIEAAVERVRAEAMAMHSSEDFNQTAAVLWEQVNKLEITGFAGTGIALFDEDGYITWWDFSSPGNVGSHEGNVNRYEYGKYPLLGKEVWEVYQQGEPYFLLEYDLPKLKRAVKEWEAIKPSVAEGFKEAIASGKLTQQWGACGRISNGFLFFDQLLPPDDDSRNILLKMTGAFELAYQRFLDLQKAEAQAREARIEAALEKVRSRTMAMRKAEELHEVVTVVVEKLVDLGVVLDANGVILCTYFANSRDVLHWIASPDFSFTGSYLLPYFDHPIFSAAWESKERGDEYFSKSFTVEEKNSFFEYAFEYSDYKDFPDEFKEWVFQNDKHSLTFAWSKNSAILIPSHTGVIPTAEEAEILKRFARVFEQAYVRFMDLQKAEMQAKEALKQAALDRVRGEIASMRSTEDLNRITPVIWRELIALDVPFIRCGVFIVDEAVEVVEVYLTTPDGKALGVLHLPFDVNSQTTNTVKYWREKEVYKEHWDAQTFTEWTQSMIEMGQVKNFADYQGSAKVPDELHLHFIPFKQGMLYVGDVNPLPDEKIEMVKTLAEAFSIAYARYEDFVRLEQAKSKVEAALAELKSTQAQLIQSEKMASLGELTAGIAHEIQNPLNFVNNFSEVSTELLDEMNEEITKGDLEEAIAIANDIKQNLEKINQHGQRADAIVKGMLQHSRKSTGEKVPTDINQLADEYLRLAYHGLRAKDKSFNATLHTEFDSSLEKVMVIPQDIGRVLLNLFNNAFYAINEKKGTDDNGYQPTVTIRTKRAAKNITIDVKDNGNGIPRQVIDKVFQPFFTTKPTGQGTGLGLSLSYDIIKAHGGELKIATEQGEGTTFTIIIPENV